MGLLKQVIAEMKPYGGIVQLDVVDKLKNDPKADAVPFTRYVQQRNAAEEEEAGEQMSIPSRAYGNDKLSKIIGSLYDMDIKSADAAIYAMIQQNKITADEFVKLLSMYRNG